AAVGKADFDVARRHRCGDPEGAKDGHDVAGDGVDGGRGTLLPRQLDAHAFDLHDRLTGAEKPVVHGDVAERDGAEGDAGAGAEPDVGRLHAEQQAAAQGADLDVGLELRGDELGQFRPHGPSQEGPAEEVGAENAEAEDSERPREEADETAQLLHEETVHSSGSPSPRQGDRRGILRPCPTSTVRAASPTTSPGRRPPARSAAPARPGRPPSRKTRSASPAPAALGFPPRRASSAGASTVRPAEGRTPCRPRATCPTPPGPRPPPARPSAARPRRGLPRAPTAGGASPDGASSSRSSRWRSTPSPRPTTPGSGWSARSRSIRSSSRSSR